ncbi:MAG: nif-specific transcriptional activator NifA [Deltaproteobacteria bacterium]|nr:MAG: nif-specific transcriptional activator NifA [Deltaproteobacteria bacterium]
MVPVRSPEKRIEELSTLYEVSQALAQSLDLQQVLERILDILSERLGMNRGTVALVSPFTGEIQIETSLGLSPAEKRRGRYRPGEGVTGRVVASGEPMVVPQIGKEPLFLNRTLSRGDLEELEISFLCVPIKAGDVVVGALSVDRIFSKESFDADVSFQDEVNFLEIIASMIGQAVKVHRMVEDERSKLVAEKERLQADLAEKYNISNIIGNSKAMHKVFSMVAQVAKSNATVLIRGESGTGKELIANAIHYGSPRAQKPLIKVNCSAIPETLIESELFGHEKGAFTGAAESKPGRFELASGGTIFLDEIGELNQTTQVKLLRVLQEREFERVGGVKTIKANLRIIAATNRNLEEQMASGEFREDLYYRLNVFPIYMPALRERRTDILLLADHFLEKYSKENSKEIKRITTPAIDMLMSYHWPGNVRELENCMERAVLLCDRSSIHSYHLPPTLQTAETTAMGEGLSLEESVSTFETDLIIDALKGTRGNIRAAAERLKTTPRILGYKVNKYGIEAKRYR